MSLPELETPAARVLYINSKDATTQYGDFSTNFDFQLEEPITVPPHHIILMSLYSAEIPYSFYYFDTGQNTRIDIQITAYGTPASYLAGPVGGSGLFNENLNQSKSVYIPEGNYNAVQLAHQLTQDIGDTVASPGVYPLKVSWNPITLKFDFVCTVVNTRVTLAISNANPFVVIGSGVIGGDMNEELGFVKFHPLPVNDGDLFVELNAAGNSWSSGYSNGNGAAAGPGVDTPTTGSPFAVATPLVAENVGDLTASVRSLFVRTNLSTNSVLDSHIGGGFSNILARIPVNTTSGNTIRVDPTNGTKHKLLIKSKTITNVSLRLTNQRNTDIDLNGLNWDVSLMMEFIHPKDIPQLEEFRKVWDQVSLKLDEEKQIDIVRDPRPDRIPTKEEDETKKKEEEKKEKK